MPAGAFVTLLKYRFRGGSNQSFGRLSLSNTTVVLVVRTELAGSDFWAQTSTISGLQVYFGAPTYFLAQFTQSREQEYPHRCLRNVQGRTQKPKHSTAMDSRMVIPCNTNMPATGLTELSRREAV